MTETELEKEIRGFLLQNGDLPDLIILNPEDYSELEMRVFGFNDPVLPSFKYNGIPVYRSPLSTLKCLDFTNKG